MHSNWCGRLAAAGALAATIAGWRSDERLGTPRPQAAVQTPTVSRRSVWVGVYTASQALRGEVVFSASCVSCHGADLLGASAEAGALKGDRFRQRWSSDSLQSLYTTIRGTMPRERPGSLPDDEYLDVAVYLLQQNGFPAGARELRHDDLPNVLIESRDGSDAMPNFALVEVVGCLTSAATDTWMLSGASDPVRVREATLAPTDLESLARRAGENTLRLQGVSTTDRRFAGQKVVVRGLLIRDPAGDRINVAALNAVASVCRP